MSVENARVVDAIGIERDSGKVILTISDHLDWTNEREHLLALQGKINTYLRFIESGELEVTYGEAVGRMRVIDVVVIHPPTDAAMEFFGKATIVCRGAGIEFRIRMLAT